MTFHVYENWTHDRSRVHRSECVFSNDGKGIQGSTTNRNGQWLGPFETIKVATRVANALGRGDTKPCGNCRP